MLDRSCCQEKLCILRYIKHDMTAHLPFVFCHVFVDIMNKLSGVPYKICVDNRSEFVSRLIDKYMRMW